LKKCSPPRPLPRAGGKKPQAPKVAEKPVNNVVRWPYSSRKWFAGTIGERGQTTKVLGCECVLFWNPVNVDPVPGMNQNPPEYARIVGIIANGLVVRNLRTPKTIGNNI
jgi:hypothetical protein